MKITQILLAIFVILSLNGCKNNKSKAESTLPVEQIYAQGIKYLEKEDYKNAALEFEQVFFKNPSHPIVAHSEIMHAYSLYKQGDHDASIDVIDIFLKLHPRHEDAAYIYYLRALNYYAQVSDIKLDQSSAINAMVNLQEVINKYPSTKYAQDANIKIRAIESHLAGKEIMIGKYYLEKSNPIAAIKRFQIILVNYTATEHMPEALFRLVEANITIGLKSEAISYHENLANNYPDSKWFLYSKKLID